MEIKDYAELNALNKLLGMIKFQENLSFYEFREFAGSSIIAEIFKRVHDEFWKESIKRGYIKEEQEIVFKFDSPVGKVIKKRVDELTKHELETLIAYNDIDSYLKILIVPYQTSKADFQLLKNYMEEKVKKART
ncbi:hypothetical protein [Adhaeribacter pallidiroseus]|uniref:Uncharacterized protein n=1 Tax=Adhaeribacter pallidiroseus TaxID=2072847 RepID=A0A369QPX4_9BACT|nr:hypothetical protein [Adhaeribacter pallidiroseus]RDC66440.1 hypothetical protein AHMF7616_05071 [Adhaeribacter pallidiroseus]